MGLFCDAPGVSVVLLRLGRRTDIAVYNESHSLQTLPEIFRVIGQLFDTFGSFICAIPPHDLCECSDALLDHLGGEGSGMSPPFWSKREVAGTMQNCSYVAQ